MFIKKKVLVFIFNGYADHQVADAMTRINSSDLYQIKTIANAMDIIKSMAGLSVIPDLDFIPEVDLPDIDRSNTAMLILPGGHAWMENRNSKIASLITHCIEQQIHVAAAGDTSASSFTAQVFGMLGINSEKFCANTFVQGFNNEVVLIQ